MASAFTRSCISLPHLSGALIAKSFEGFAEFGYRPFTGPISMLGVESNYSIDLYKYSTGTDKLLDGATFGFFPVDDEGNVSEKPSEEVVVDNGHINYPITPGKYALKETKDGDECAGGWNGDPPGGPGPSPGPLRPGRQVHQRKHQPQGRRGLPEGRCVRWPA